MTSRFRFDIENEVFEVNGWFGNEPTDNFTVTKVVVVDGQETSAGLVLSAVFQASTRDELQQELTRVFPSHTNLRGH